MEASLSHEKEQALTLATMWTDPEDKMLSERSRHRRTDTGCDSTDGKCPEQADPQTQRVGSWLSGAGARNGVTADGDRVSSEVTECSGTGERW